MAKNIGLRLKKEIEIGVEQLVIAELTYGFYLATQPVRDEAGVNIGPDKHLIKSLSTVIQYFSSVEQIAIFFQTFQPVIDDLNSKFKGENYEF